MDVFGTAFLPNIFYLQQIIASKQPGIDLGEHFIKQTQRNRAIILSSNGSLPIIIPLRKSNSKRVGDMEISYAEDWQIKALRAIQSSYKNAPYYEHYQLEFEDILMRKYSLLWEYNKLLLEWLFQQLDIELHIQYFTHYIEDGYKNDYRPVDFYVTKNSYTISPYKQVFSHKMNFREGLSGIDLLFNKGPEALPYIQ